jgi:hypothetical protein
MNPIRLSAALALFAFAAPAPAAAETVVPVGKFNSIQLRGGGEVRLRYGPVQRVTILKGSTAYTTVSLKSDGGRARAPDRLVIDACNNRCPRQYDLEIEIVTPDVQAVAVQGGGTIQTAGRFPARDSLAAAVHGGGHIDVRSAEVASIAAAVHGGGTIYARPQAALAAAIKGGGDIRYWGDPQVVTSIEGGGHVRRGSGN